MSEENNKKQPTFFEIASRIVTFCDRMDKIKGSNPKTDSGSILKIEAK